MKPLVAVLGLVGGVVLSLVMFAGGIAVATWLPEGEPERRLGSGPEVAELWAPTPRSVDRSAQDFERIAAVQAVSLEPSRERADDDADVELATVDPVTTSSAGLAADEDAVDFRTSQMSSAHIEWCGDRYRSYQPDANVYTAYSGELRRCVSPYTDELAAALQGGSQEQEMVEEDLAEADVSYLPEEQAMNVSMSSDHVNDCFSRYRSYRPEDNTYQPYDGGPRRQCQ